MVRPQRRLHARERSRRHPDRGTGGRIRDGLALHFGKNSVFTDIDSIPLGVDFLEYINSELSTCDVLIAIVGPRWVDAGQGPGQGVHLETDFVRIEVEAALKRKIPVIPALVAETRMPRPDELPEPLRPFVFRNATAIDSGVNFRNDIDRLIRSLDRILPANKTQEKSQIPYALTEGEGPATKGEWTAKLIFRGKVSFLIELVRFDERHRLEFEPHAFSSDKLKLDGVEIEKVYWLGRKKKDFQIGAHSARFRLQFNIFAHEGRLSNIELWCDGRSILQVN